MSNGEYTLTKFHLYYSPSFMFLSVQFKCHNCSARLPFLCRSKQCLSSCCVSYFLRSCVSYYPHKFYRYIIRSMPMPTLPLVFPARLIFIMLFSALFEPFTSAGFLILSTNIHYLHKSFPLVAYSVHVTMNIHL